MSAIRDRYLQDPVPVRLGGLAANLARIQSFSDHPEHSGVVRRLLQESKLLIEWTAPEAEPESLPELAAIQRELAGWDTKWEQIWDDPSRRLIVAERAGELSRRVLELSGLLPRT